MKKPVSMIDYYSDQKSNKRKQTKNLSLNSVCSIRHDFYGGCRDSAEGGRFCR